MLDTSMKNIEFIIEGLGLKEKYLSPFKTDKNKTIIASLKKKTIAVCSGKGGVGKTTTAANLAVYYSKKGLKTGLIDLDPLSDTTSLLDIEDSEAVKFYDNSKNKNFSSNVINVFDKLDILYPASKLGKEDSFTIYENIYKKYSENINSNYDIIILDLPAGNRIEDNMVYLPFAEEIILVTNPEPTAHVSAGGYIKNIFELKMDRKVNIWHNKCYSNKNLSFSPFDVAENYNRNVEEDARLTKAEVSQIVNLAYIPKDPSLDLIHGHPSVQANLLHNIKNMVNLIFEKHIKNIVQLQLINKNTSELIKYYFIKNPEIKKTDKYLEELGEYIKGTLFNKLVKSDKFEQISAQLKNISIFTDEEKAVIQKNIDKVSKDEIVKQIVKTLKIIEHSIEESEKSKGLFSIKSESVSAKGIDRELASLLMIISKSKNRIIIMDTSVLLFYYSMFKLYQSKTIIDFTQSFIPTRKDSRGNTVRDRNKLISYLTQKDDTYREKYFNLIKTIYPIVNKQLSTVIQTFSLQNLVIKNKNGINKEAYLKLLSNFVHDSLFSGLSIIVGFEYRNATQEFQKAAEELLNKLNIK